MPLDPPSRCGMGHRHTIQWRADREDTMQDQVIKVLDKIRPSLQADGGDVELVDIVDGIVKVRLKGA